MQTARGRWSVAFTRFLPPVTDFFLEIPAAGAYTGDMKNSILILAILLLPASAFARGARFSGGRSGAGRGNAYTGSARAFAPRSSTVHASPIHASPFRSAVPRAVAPRAPSRTATAATTPTPAPWAVQGALIRSEGLGFKTSPAAPSAQHVVAAGAIDASGTIPLTTQPAVFRGPKDTPPPASQRNGSGGGASGRTAITPNGSGGN